MLPFQACVFSDAQYRVGGAFKTDKTPVPLKSGFQTTLKAIDVNVYKIERNSTVKVQGTLLKNIAARPVRTDNPLAHEFNLLGFYAKPFSKSTGRFFVDLIQL